MSLYAEYLHERTDDKILESEFGFATYRHLPEEKSTYIVDIYVSPEQRKSHLATSMADHISKEAKALGYEKMLGSVIPSTKGSTESLKILLAYGMKLKSCTQNFILFEKEIS